jgi:hypothetical protein
MSIKKSVCSKLIKSFQLRELFNQLGWDDTSKKEQVAVDSLVYQLEAIAKKSAFYVFVCETAGKVPDYATRKKIDTTITKLYHEHLIVYIDSAKRQQVWQLVVKELDKPAVVRETHYYATQEPELLFQKLQHLFFSIDEEDNITIADVTGRIGGAFNTNADKVTKKFYEGFKKEHTAFLGFIKGIPLAQDKDWYASLMLNRLMFIYFIQKKGFLDNDRDYLRTKLSETQGRKGKDKFYSFYRNFLLVLFHRGLGSPDNKKLERELGKVPYLNGGLFDVHELELAYIDIQIEDKAFRRIFDFFDQYEWHLDTRQQATGKEINPDVIGYIFEKYINDRAAMGAYYTKEDITNYIGKNCIIPFLFDELKRSYSAALKEGGDVWALLQQRPTDYIYLAIQHGVELELPVDIAKGLDDVGKREEWNKSAPSEYALPTEIWREVVERRRRYAEVKGKIEAGEIHEINDLITYNLNITRFAIDVIQNCSDPELIRHFYKALEKITVLDPTCGSGAFLFAALGILEPLYEACIGRMHAFVDESAVGKFKAFDEVLKRVEAPEHPNLQYFIFKSIILNNLYGVDIMHEAIEIAKLRLFLKLVACVDVELKKPNMGLEPLPDIDFNIRAGNTLVGFVSIDEVKKAVEGQLGFHDKDIADIEEAAEYVKRAYDSFREVQIAGDATVKEFKKILTEKLAKLNDRLDVYLGKLYGKDPKKIGEFKAWHDSHKPFHWFAEFYEIVHDQGGFDVIIGNPPYVELSDVKKQYEVRGFITIETGNLFSICVERFYRLLGLSSRQGVIIPISSVSTPRMLPLMKLCKEVFSELFISNYSVRPGKLFTGVDMNLSIFIGKSGAADSSIMSTRYYRWNEEFRPILFQNLCYQETILNRKSSSIVKFGYKLEESIHNKINTIQPLSYYQIKSVRSDVIYYHSGGRYFRKCLLEKLSNEYKELKVQSGVGPAAVCSISSSLYYWLWIIFSDCYHVTKRDIEYIPLAKSLLCDKSLANLSDDLLTDLNINRITINRNRADGTQRKEINFKVGKSKHIIDKIDSVLAKHYGFTDEELDFIINYDIKYRMGKGGGDDEDTE